MAYLGLIFIGAVFGFFLSLIVAAFAVLRLDPKLRDEVFNGRKGVRELFGSKKVASSDFRTPELEAKIRSLTDEVRVSQKLLEQAKQERTARLEDMGKLRLEFETVQLKVAETREESERLLTDLDERNSARHALEAEMSQRDVELARANSEIKDLRTELEVARAGDSFTADQLVKLKKERDALLQLVQRMRQQQAAKAPAEAAPST
jgi:chromosome segregation ATPase